MFRAPHAPSESGPSYCCQNDGMVGLGTGARSYTQDLHYSTDYAVGRVDTMGIIDSYLALDADSFTHAHHGFALGPDEQRRRYVIQSLLTDPGLDPAAYRQRFGGDCMQDLPQLHELGELGLLEEGSALMRLNDRGYEYADTIGPWLASENVRLLMADGGTTC